MNIRVKLKSCLSAFARNQFSVFLTEGFAITLAFSFILRPAKTLL
jgi:hypothetical protein